MGEVGVAAFVGEGRAVDVVPFAAAYPAHFGEDEGDGFAGGEFGFVQRHRRFAFADDGAARVAVGFGVSGEFVADEGEQVGAAAQEFVELLFFSGEGLFFGADLLFFEAGEVAQAGVQYGFGLGFAEVEGAHEDGARFVFAADDADDFVEVEVDDEQACEDVQAVVDGDETVVQAAAHGVFAVGQPFAEDLPQVFDLRAAIEADHVHLRAVAFFEVGGGKEVLHEALVIDAVGARDEDEAHGVFVVGFVTQVIQPGEFFRLHLFGDLFLDFATGNLVGQLVDDDVAVFEMPGGAQADGAAPGAVEGGDFFARGDEFATGREVRRGDVLHDFVVGEQRVGKEGAAGGDDFAQVVRQEVGRHADGDTAAAVQEDVWQPGRQARGFLQGAIEVGDPGDGALFEFGKQGFGVAGQAAFGVAHGGEGFGVVRTAPVALPVHQRIAVGEVLRHQHHRFVAGDVAVRVVFADDVADGARGFFVFGLVRKAELAHGVDDAALHGFEAVADMRQGAVEDDVHGVVEVGFFDEAGQGLLFFVGREGHGVCVSGCVI